MLRVLQRLILISLLLLSGASLADRNEKQREQFLKAEAALKADRLPEYRRLKQSLGDYLNSGWMERVDPTTVETFSVNGFPAATATARGGEWSFRIFAVRFGSDVYRFIFAAKVLTIEADRSFRESVFSFRRMSLKEAEQVRPLRLKIVTVGPHDSVHSLARRMDVSDHKLERFRVINGLGPKNRVKAGEVVKLVVE